MLDSADQILIAGGGIGGLTLALALAKWGRKSRILEARDTFSTAGAGIQLGPNATRLLDTLGLSDALQRHAVSPQSINVREAASGRALAELPLGAWMRERYQAPYWLLHRADLQSCLLDAARASPLIEISTGFTVAGGSEDATGVTVTSTNGDSARGPILVGCDGLWSRVRSFVEPKFDLRFSGATAARAIIDMDTLPASYSEPVTGVWLAPSAHVVHYPVRGGRALAIIVISTEDRPDDDWGTPWPTAEVQDRVSAFDDDLRNLISHADDWHRWALFNPPPLSRWSSGRVVLVGDAAHPILPFLAQGGAMAIEDAMVLGWEIARGYGSHAHIFDAYDMQRRNRVHHIQKASRENGSAYHLSGLAAGARNLTLSSTPGAVLMKRYDWIYGWHHDMAYGEIEL